MELSSLGMMESFGCAFLKSLISSVAGILIRIGRCEDHRSARELQGQKSALSTSALASSLPRGTGASKDIKLRNRLFYVRW